jgi:hypothetical protein
VGQTIHEKMLYKHFSSPLKISPITVDTLSASRLIQAHESDRQKEQTPLGSDFPKA